MEIREIVKRKTKTAKPEVVKELLDKERKEHSKMVKGKFEFTDAQGGWLEFNYRYFPEDMLVTYKFFHGEVCEIPMGLVKHLNNTVKKVRHIGMNSGAVRGNELPQRGLPSSFEVNSRVRFTPVEVL